MKFEDIKLGARVTDHVGNVYQVIDTVPEDPWGYTIRLRCLYFSKTIGVGYDSYFDAKGKELWIQGKRKRLLNIQDPIVLKLMKELGYNPEHKAGYTLTMKDSAGDMQDFYVRPADIYNSFVLTADELRPVQALSHGMKFKDSANKLYTLVGYDVLCTDVAWLLPDQSATGSSPMVVQTSIEPTGTLRGFVPAED